MGKRRIGICGYCGEKKETSDDHVFPECIFIQPYPPNLPSIYSCDSCNNKSKSKFDSFLRDLITVDVQATMSDESRHHHTQKFIRSAIKNRSILARSLEKREDLKPFYSHEGEVISYNMSAADNENNIRQCFSYLSRGIYFYLHKEILSSGFNFQVIRYHEKQFAEFLLLIENMAGTIKWHELGDVVSYSTVIFHKEPHISLIFFKFNKGINISVYVTEDMQHKLSGKMRRFGHSVDSTAPIE